VKNRIEDTADFSGSVNTSIVFVPSPKLRPPVRFRRPSITSNSLPPDCSEVGPQPAFLRFW
jgi:hypothetical protein